MLILHLFHNLESRPALNPTGTGDCDGITNAAGQVVKIPCSCPPDRNAFLQVCPRMLYMILAPVPTDLVSER